MTTTDKIIDFLTNHPEIAFSGWGLTALTATLLLSKYIIRLIRSVYGRLFKNETLLQPPVTQKNPLTEPKFAISQISLSLTGGFKPVQNYEFKLTNSGGKAFNCVAYVDYLNATVDLKDINRHNSKVFTLKFGDFALPQLLNFKVTYLDEDGDPSTRFLNMALIGRDYRPA
ncbi:hypothetical protein [Pseudomonas sp. Marseille-P8916]|uniref:hypothetical protein n=1 Tax=Pseudomonas sp. Marseille-P8916 TaxID=2866589 RepID=UPI001CE4A4BA|nr:hypothetical protein [Pseudomonas sp. Marseille-P8916]